MKNNFLSQLLQEAREKYNIPAIATVILDSDSIIFKDIQGVRVIGKTDLVTFDDYFHIGSCSKSILALMAAKLIESGKINWNTKFFDVFPEIKNEANKDYFDITLEDLFLCEAGIQPYTSGVEKFPELDAKVENKRLEFMKHLVKQNPASKKSKNGKKFEHLYSNAGYTMASAMLERVYGKTYEELVKETITDSLGLSVHIGWPNDINSNQPWGHGDWPDNKFRPFPPDDEYKLNYLIIPAGDLSMKPLDFAKYTQLHLKGLRGIGNYISSNNYKHIHFGHKGFSLGVANNNIERKIISGFDGSAGTFYCRSIIIPADDLAFTIMINSGSIDAVNWITMKIVKKHYNWWWKFWM